MIESAGLRADAFFLEADPGPLFALLYEPTGVVRGGFVYVHPFAEEMNKARRMAALQARAWAQAGYAVLLLDLYGCGDSAGDFGEADWVIWKNNARSAADWLERRVGQPVGLWGLRVGALLAAEVASQSPTAFSALVLWQPVVNGDAFLTQFLRLKVATEMLADGGDKVDTQALKKMLEAGEHVEIAGYSLSPALARGLREAKLDALKSTVETIVWREVVAQSDRPLAPPSLRVVQQWREGGCSVDAATAVGEPFWITPEIAESHALIESTLQPTRAFQP